MIPITTTLADRTAAVMLARAQEDNVRARQEDAGNRLLILEDNWLHIPWGYILQIYKTPVVRRALCLRLKATINVLKQIAGRVCVAYKVPPIRSLKGAPQQSQDAFNKLVKESRIRTRAKKIEKQVFALNVVLVIPVVRRDPAGLQRLDFEVIPPHAAEVTTDPNDLMGDPIAVAFDLKDGSDHTGTPLVRCVLDAEAWRYYDKHDQLVQSIPHGAGVCPAVAWRIEDPTDDWWCSHRGEGLVHATIEVCHLAARMDWVRHGQDRWKELLVAENLELIGTQIAGAEGPVEITGTPGNAVHTALNINTPIESHREHIRFYRDEAAESVGVPSVLVDFDPTASNYANVTATANTQQQSALADVRLNHIAYHTLAEQMLWWKTALVLRGARHPLASLLPPDLVAEDFAIEFPELTFVEHPQVRMSVAKERIAIGLSSTFREYQREHPELTFDESKAQVLAIAQEEGELNQFYIDHNLSRDPDERRKTLAQLQGKQGGEASGEARQTEDDDDDEREPGRADDGDGDSSE